MDMSFTSAALLVFLLGLALYCYRQIRNAR